MRTEGIIRRFKEIKKYTNIYMTMALGEFKRERKLRIFLSRMRNDKFFETCIENASLIHSDPRARNNVWNFGADTGTVYESVFVAVETQASKEINRLWEKLFIAEEVFDLQMLLVKTEHTSLEAFLEKKFWRNKNAITECNAYTFGFRAGKEIHVMNVDDSKREFGYTLYFKYPKPRDVLNFFEEGGIFSNSSYKISINEIPGEKEATIMMSCEYMYLKIVIKE